MVITIAVFSTRSIDVRSAVAAGTIIPFVLTHTYIYQCDSYQYTSAYITDIEMCAYIDGQRR